ncbi:GMC oxidoreductase [Chelativorans intermedius]|uniref:GMC oxidoreductase n=1 Tax=Chelativorans intermedius TaxID=515947 RepID=A0ABV6D5V1_9HYPH|nr:GMC family oxidoreductase [Chelativorans intermedius]MCT8997511.1 GMC family oxidoreductase [Chelativorans intermedius]
MTSPDIVIIGTGMGGASVAAGLAHSGASILLLERGERLADTPECIDARAIFAAGHFRPKEMWREAGGGSFNPGNYYYVGGNTKFYGAVLIRFRRQDFCEIEHHGGLSPAWPFPYEELEPWYSKAEALFNVRGTLGEDPTEPPHSAPYPFPPVPDEPPIARLRERLRKIGLNPASLPLGVDHALWLQRAATPWDAFPNAGRGKMDAESCALAAALKDENVRLETGARVERLEASRDGRSIARIHYRVGAEQRTVSPKLVILSAGAVNSAALLLRSGEDGGLANSSGQVGRNFMNHNSAAMLAIDPRRRNDSIYQKTLGFNDFYLGDGEGGKPLGNVQLLGKISGDILRPNVPLLPAAAANFIAAHSVDWYLMTEDLPDPESRVMVDGSEIVLQWRRTNLESLQRLTRRMRTICRATGYPIVLSRPFDKRTPSHQCGTVRIGRDPASAPLDPYCRSYDHRNLFVVDASFLPSSAAVNPALTIAAQALRVADHIRRKELS